MESRAIRKQKPSKHLTYPEHDDPQSFSPLPPVVLVTRTQRIDARDSTDSQILDRTLKVSLMQDRTVRVKGCRGGKKNRQTSFTKARGNIPRRTQTTEEKKMKRRRKQKKKSSSLPSFSGVLPGWNHHLLCHEPCCCARSQHNRALRGAANGGGKREKRQRQL